MQLVSAVLLLLVHSSSALLVNHASLQVRALQYGHKHVCSQKHSSQTVMLASPLQQIADEKTACVTLQAPRPLPAAVTWAVFASVWATLTR
jgi:hypothetical protein